MGWNAWRTKTEGVPIRDKTKGAETKGVWILKLRQNESELSLRQKECEISLR